MAKVSDLITMSVVEFAIACSELICAVIIRQNAGSLFVNFDNIVRHNIAQLFGLRNTINN